MTDGSDGERCVVLADAAGIFAETHIERVVQRVLDGPVAACIGEDLCRFRCIAAEIKSRFRADFIANAAGGGDAHNAL